MTTTEAHRISKRRDPFRFYKIAPSSVGLAVPFEPVTDLSQMSATAIISTPAIDRLGDSLVSTGCQLDEYRLNPAVFWEHGMDYALPIGKSEHPDGSLAVIIRPTEISATCYFAKSLEAEQIFALVDDGIIKATSVRARPIQSSSCYVDGEQAFCMDQWALEEWSWVGVGMNPEAVREVVSKNRLAGRQIFGPLLSSLKCLSASCPAQGRGWSASEKHVPRDTPILDGEPGDTDEEDELERNPEVDAIDDEMKPFGKRFLRAQSFGVADLLEQSETARPLIENETVRDATEEVDALLQKALKICQTCHTDQYGEQLEVRDEPAPPAESRKSLGLFLAANKGERLPFSGVGRQLRSLARCHNLRPWQRKEIASVQKTLHRVIREADEAPRNGECSEELLCELREASESMSEAVQELKSVCPCDTWRQENA